MFSSFSSRIPVEHFRMTGSFVPQRLNGFQKSRLMDFKVVLTITLQIERIELQGLGFPFQRVR